MFESEIWPRRVLSLVLHPPVDLLSFQYSATGYLRLVKIDQPRPEPPIVARSIAWESRVKSTRHLFGRALTPEHIESFRWS